MIFRKRTDNIWENISDLMTGLMIVFIFVCLSFLFQINHNRQNYNMIHDQIYKDLQEEFKPEEMARWGTNINPKTLTVSFYEPRVYFGTNDATVSPEFQKVLQEFFPRYVKVVQKYDDIVEVRIEGNASLEWNGDVKSKEAYFYNMKLSQDRAFNVLQYVYAMDSMQGERDWLIAKLRANGASYSNANENVSASRCVEISIKRDTEQYLGVGEKE